MNISEYNRLLQWFETYTAACTPDTPSQKQAYELKYGHSLRVVAEMDALCREEGIDAQAHGLARIVALLHDVGRWEQFRRYATFSDRHSCDHGRLGVEQLQIHGVLDSLDATARRVIEQAIGLHNKRLIPDNLAPEVLEQVRLIRDADKLDIWRVVTDHFASGEGERDMVVGVNLPQTVGVSPQVAQAVMQQTMVPIEHCRTLCDYKLLQMAWIHDLHFTHSLRIVRQRHYLEKLLAILPSSPQVHELYEQLAACRDSRIAQGRQSLTPAV